MPPQLLCRILQVRCFLESPVLKPGSLILSALPACLPAEPYTMSVRKRASRMSVLASDFAVRSVGGKAHRG